MKKRRKRDFFRVETNPEEMREDVLVFWIDLKKKIFSRLVRSVSGGLVKNVYYIKFEFVVSVDMYLMCIHHDGSFSFFIGKKSLFSQCFCASADDGPRRK